MSTRTSLIAIGILAAALVALGIFTVARTGNLNSKVDELETTTAGLEESTASGGKDVAEELATLSLSVKKLRACLPELQNEIDNLSVEIEPGFAYVENNSQVSSYCRPVVYPEPRLAGE